MSKLLLTYSANCYSERNIKLYVLIRIFILFYKLAIFFTIYFKKVKLAFFIKSALYNKENRYHLLATIYNEKCTLFNNNHI